ncbi:MAG TPA: site-specific DNA-methyltransferase, partial [Deltaproteobacteria bacterium]|nr:site-specific DNA-methyltransferase [Deltaproteobacteria bacterium]
KNEVMNLDDVQNAERFADIEKNLRMIQCLRAIALDLITFLAQLEDFQKKLWLKKKFVVAAHYCVTLDRIIKDAPELLAVIAAENKQWEQWDKLGMLDGKKDDLFKQAKNGTVDYLREHQFLMLDTALFDAAFKGKLLGTIDNLDESLDGLLIHGDNFQALNLLQERYREQVKCVYIDPPYNTGGDDFNYKDSYQHSSWLSMMFDRIVISSVLMHETSPIFCSIDQDEWHELRMLFSAILGTENYVNEIVWQKLTAAKKQSSYFSNLYEKIMCFRKSESMKLNKIYIQSNKDESNYPYIEETTSRRYGSFDFTQKGQGMARWFGDKLLEPPIDKHWIWGQDKINEGLLDGRIIFTKNGMPRVKRYLDEKEGNAVGDFWVDDEIKPLSANDSERIGFYTQKPLCLLIRVLKSATSNSLVLDYFAGSGTTGHAVINLNRQDNGNRKYILVEQGEYFDTVLKPRIQKVVYSADWKDGKATAPQTGISHAFKVLKIESYEDTLNNLNLRHNDAQQSLLSSLSEGAKEDYLLRYMLDIESQGSILSVDSFRKPFDCKLKVAVDSAGAFEERTIDLVETFNFLIGLRVKTIDSLQERGIVMVQGTLPT